MTERRADWIANTQKSLPSTKSSADLSKNRPVRMKKVSQEHVKYCHHSMLKETGLLTEITEAKSQVLEILDCQSLENIFNLLIDSNFHEFINRSSFFVIILNCDIKVAPDQLEILDECFKKPFILQFYSSARRTSQLFFKDDRSEKFKMVAFSEESRIDPQGDFAFSNLMNLIAESIPESVFSKLNLLELMVNTEESVGDKRLIDWAVQHNDVLSVQFLQLFGVDLKTLNSEEKRVLEVAAENGSLECLKALVGVGNSNSAIDPTFLNALNQTSVSGKTLLMIAAENGRNGVVDFLLETGISAQTKTEEGQTASDLAWNKGHYEIVVSIISKGDGPFPKKFDESKLKSENPEAFVNYKNHMTRLEDFRENIKNNDIYKITLFIEDNPLVRHGYCPRNECILSFALKNDNMYIYVRLRSIGFTNGIDENFERILCDLDERNKLALAKFAQSYVSPSSSQHIMELVSKSRLGVGRSQDHFKKIQEYFEALDAIDKIKPILKLVAQDRNVKIVFDFTIESITSLDPRNISSVSEEVFGRTCLKSGFIIISALRDELLVLGTLAHELTHFAINIAYDNACLPFFSHDTKRRERYCKVMKQCKDYCEDRNVEESRNPNAVIKNTFSVHFNQNADPNQDTILKELIVCVPQLIALHSKEDENALKDERCKLQPLFNFFDEVLVDLEKSILQIKPIELKRKIQDINELFKVFPNVIESLHFSDKNRNEFIEIMKTARNQLVTVTSPTPELLLSNFFQFLEASTAITENIFVDVDHLVNTKYIEKIEECHWSDVKPIIFVLLAEGCFRELDENVIFNHFKERVILIKFECCGPYNYKWNDLTAESQDKVLNRKAKFQGQSVYLRELATGNENFLHNTPLNEILSLVSSEIINNLVPAMPKIFITRNFRQVSGLPIEEQSALDLIVKKKFVILADDAGMGKSTCAIYLANRLIHKLQTSWIVYLELKNHINNYRPDNDPSVVNVDFFVNTLFCDRSSIQKNLFRHFFQSGKVIFFLDGFDEISPKFKNFVLSMVAGIVTSRNRFLLTTRTFLCDQIKLNVGAVTLSLNGFTIEDRENFLHAYWDEKHPGVCVKDLEKKAKFLLKSYGNECVFENPLSLSMLAMTHSDPMTMKGLAHLNVNMFSLFDHFLKVKLEIFHKQKGDLAFDDQMDINMRCQNVVSLHHKMALSYLMDWEAANILDSERLEKKDRELLSRFGMLQIFKDGELKFNHQAYAEFFVADFIIRNFTNRYWKPCNGSHVLFLKVLTVERHEGIRNFLNQKLSLGKAHPIEGLAGKLSELLICTDYQGFLPILIAEKRYSLLNFIFITLKYDPDVKIQIILNNVLNGSPFQKAFYSDVVAFRAIWTCIQGFTNREMQKLILSEHTEQWKKFFENVEQAKNKAVVDFVRELQRKILQGGWLQNLFVCTKPNNV